MPQTTADAEPPDDAPVMVTARNAHGTEVTVTEDEFKDRYKPAGYKKIRIVEEDEGGE